MPIPLKTRRKVSSNKLTMGLMSLTIIGILYWANHHDEVLSDSPVTAGKSPSVSLPNKREVPSITPSSPVQEMNRDELPDARDLLSFKRTELLKKRADIKAYRDLTEKALRTSDEEIAYKKMLADKSQIEIALYDILHPDDQEDFKESSLKRQYQIDFLSDAAAWEENPNRMLAIKNIETGIMTPLNEQLNERFMKSAAGDRLELYLTLYAIDPSRASLLKESIADERIRKIIRFAGHYEKLAKATN